MNFLAFQKTFNHLPVISGKSIEMAFPGYDPNALTRWQKVGYIQKIRNGYYRLSDQAIRGDAELFFISNRIYSPSYISLQSALSWHGYIPEGVFTTTAISTLKTTHFETEYGVFQYRSISPKLFFGYALQNFGAYQFKIADPAKALLDLIYFNPLLSSESHFHELRFNFFEIKESFSATTYEQYLSCFNSRSMNNRAKALLKFLDQNVTLN